METKELVDKITGQILARLRETSGGNGKARAGSAAAGGGAASVRPEATGQGAASAQGAPLERSWGKPAAEPQQYRGLRPAEVARYIDHTLLKPEASREQIDRLCDEAVEYGFYSVCVNTAWSAYCARRLRGKGVRVATVVGFPLGAMDSRSKSFETRSALEHGSDEIDMVMNVGAMKSGDLKTVEEDIRSVLRACRQNTVLKVIIECALLSDEEKVLACQIAKRCGAHFVKTSTGFAASGATVEDVALMRRTVGLEMGVKAAGGIRSYEDALAMIQAGASRLGTSASAAIVTGAKSQSKY
jgi:deoxyribose-phosphate aldolase